MSHDLTAIKDRLLKQRAELLAARESSSDARRPVELDQQAVGRVSRIDAIQQQAMALAAEQRRQQMMTRIDATLKRIAQDNFGYCAVCDEEIGEGRLALDPTVATCVRCAQNPC